MMTQGFIMEGNLGNFDLSLLKQDINLPLPELSCI